MTSAVPTLLAKIAYLRPRIICFVGKGIWLHVQRSLRRLGIGDDDDDAGTRAVLAADASETVLMPVVLKEESIECSRVTKPESEPVGFGHGVAAKSEPDAQGEGDHHPRPKQILTVQRVIKQQAPDTTLSTPSPFATGCRSVSSRNAAPKRGTAAVLGPTRTFAYGLQPYKAVHSMEPNVRILFFFWLGSHGVIFDSSEPRRMNRNRACAKHCFASSLARPVVLSAIRCVYMERCHPQLMGDIVS
jgi:hypothetical protein